MRAGSSADPPGGGALCTYRPHPGRIAGRGDLTPALSVLKRLPVLNGFHLRCQFAHLFFNGGEFLCIIRMRQRGLTQNTDKSRSEEKSGIQFSGVGRTPERRRFHTKSSENYKTLL
ncbi:hypothetical protein Amal_04057 [Acetobacter malorum]|uniref:Uncharacterized protein n=1 Tax=Acetobacter malorum TaxID=178901 RepID=A0A177FV80_9PROT|nr:hypothetical protein Amal_04057 [Acetobacter malorum]